MQVTISIASLEESRKAFKPVHIPYGPPILFRSVERVEEGYEPSDWSARAVLYEYMRGTPSLPQRFYSPSMAAVTFGTGETFIYYAQSFGTEWMLKPYRGSKLDPSRLPDPVSENPGPYALGVIELLGAMRPANEFGWVRAEEIGKRLRIDDVQLHFFLEEAQRDHLIETRPRRGTTEHRLTTKGAGAYTMAVIPPEDISYENAKQEAHVEILYGADVLKGGEVTPIMMVTDMGGRRRPGWSVFFSTTRKTFHRAIDGAGYDQGRPGLGLH